MNSLIIGSIYALVAAGFSLIYKANKFFHFAHGSVVTFSGYMFYLAFSSLNLGLVFSSIFALVLAGALGWGFYEGVYLPIQKRGASKAILLIVSVGLMILIENLILLFFGANVKVLKIGSYESLNILGAIVTPLQLVIIGVSVILFLILYYIINKTKIGRDLRAVSDSKELSSIVGINSRRVLNFSFIIGSFIAGIGGILIGMEQNLTPTMGMILGIKGFTGAVIGGMASVPAAVLGSYILGIVENFGIWYLPSGYKDAIAFILLFLFLLLKPEGLFGKKMERKG
jgi:branched-chain amino acid transport system permease protein